MKINLIMYFLLILGIYFSVSDHVYGIEWWIDNSLINFISNFWVIYYVYCSFINYLKIKL